MFGEIIPITITTKAVQEIKSIIQTKNIPSNYGLRVGIKGGACGAELIIGFDVKSEKDQVYTVEDIEVYIDVRHTLFLAGKQVDFHDGADARGFIFIDAPESDS